MKRTMQLLSVLALVLVVVSAIGFASAINDAMSESPPGEVSATNSVLNSEIATNEIVLTIAEDGTIAAYSHAVTAAVERDELTAFVLDYNDTVRRRATAADNERRIASPYRQPTRAVSQTLDL